MFVVLLMGDFKLSNVKWSGDLFLPGMTRSEQIQVESLLNFTKLYMEQIILRPSRENNILDLCFTNNVDLIHNVKVIMTLISDHANESL